MSHRAHFPEIPDIRIIKLEAHGPVGRVFRARSNTTHALVAVKQISRKITAHPKFVAFLQDAVSRLSEVRHPNLARPLRIEKCDESYFLIMEYVEGVSLREWLRQQGRLSEGEAMDYVLQAARGIQCAARAGVLHWDLKPSNLLLTEDRQVKVTDFWMRFHRYVESARGQELHELMEFPLYMSPEERRREPVTPSSNVFSLGAILHHCVWGTPLQTAEGLREQPRAETESRLSTRTREVLDRMVAPSPQERFADCAELVDTLEGVGKGKPDFASVALCAGVVLAAVSSLIFFLKAASGLSPSSAGASISAASAAYPAASAESSRAETEFLASELFYFQHPERSGQAASRYQQIEDRFPGTVWAFNARKRIQEIGEQQREEQAREWERLTRDVARHRKDGHFAEAMGRIEDAGRSLWAAPLKSRLHALEEDILQAERSEYQETRGRAAALAAKGNLDQAARELDFVFRYYASKGIRESARRDSCTLREERRLPETQAPSP